MNKVIKSALVQLNSGNFDFENSNAKHIKDFLIEKHIKYLEEAHKNSVNIICFQELFNSPYFCAVQNNKFFDYSEEIPGYSTNIFLDYSKKYNMVIILPIFEKEKPGTYYNSAAVLDCGKFLGLYRKNHIPHLNNFNEKFYFKPGNLGYPVFKTTFAKIAVYICYDRHFPEGARIYGLNGAEIVYNPSATIETLSKHLWKIEQPSHSIANRYFMGCINRVGVEKPWNIGNFYGNSYFVDPEGKILIEGSNCEELIICDLNLGQIEDSRKVFQFYRDRRPETYKDIFNDN